MDMLFDDSAYLSPLLGITDDERLNDFINWDYENVTPDASPQDINEGDDNMCCIPKIPLDPTYPLTSSRQIYSERAFDKLKSLHELTLLKNEMQTKTILALEAENLKLNKKFVQFESRLTTFKQRLLKKRGNSEKLYTIQQQPKKRKTSRNFSSTSKIDLTSLFAANPIGRTKKKMDITFDTLFGLPLSKKDIDINLLTKKKIQQKKKGFLEIDLNYLRKNVTSTKINKPRKRKRRKCS